MPAARIDLRQYLDQFTIGLEALRGVLCHHPQDCGRNLRVEIRNQRVRGQWLLSGVPLNYLLTRAANEGHLASDCMVEGRAQGIDVATGINGTRTQGLLRGHIRNGTSQRFWRRTCLRSLIIEY